MYTTDNQQIKPHIFSKGVQYMLISTFCFSVMQALIKLMPQFNSFQHIFFRSGIGWILSVAYLRHNHISLIGKNNKMLIIRSVIGCASMFSFFYVLTRIPFGSSVIIKYLSPIFATIFSMILLKEKISPVQWVFILISFSGIILLKGFDARIGFFDFIIGVFSAISGGFLFIVIRKIGNDDHPLVILHYFMFISTLVSGIVSIYFWRTPAFSEISGLLAIGVVGFFAQNYFTKSIQAAEQVSLLANLRYLEIGYALIIGYFLFGETYTYYSFLGIILIFLGLLLSLKYKRNTEAQ